MAGHHAFVFIATPISGYCDSDLADPTLLVGGGQPAPGTQSTPTVQPAGTQPSVTLGAGSAGQLSAHVTTAPGATAVLVVDYAGGMQTVLGPAPAGPGGALTLTWTRPSGASGVVHVTLDSAGKVAQATFSLS